MAGAISQPRQSCQFLFCLMKNPRLYRSAWPESSREASERFLVETLGRTQSERRRRLGLAGGFRLLRSFGIDRLGAPDSGTPGRGGMLMACCLCRRASSRVGGGGIGSIRGPSGGGRFIGAVAAPLGPT